MRQEIEVKARVKDLSALKEKLISLGCSLSEPKVQRDVIFVNYTEPEFHISRGLKANANFLRVRKSNDKIFFTIKQSQGVNELVADEREVEINNAEEMIEAIKLLGYHEAVRVNKTRVTAAYDKYEICLDEVEKLGTFVEVEKITEDEDPEKVQGELFDLLKSWGIDESQRIVNGYDTLVYMKDHGYPSVLDN